MTFDDIETAIGQRLSVMAACPPVAWPNKDAPANALPFVEFRHLPNTREAPGLDGSGLPICTGIVLITVVSARDAFTGPANTIAQNIAAHFPKALRLTAGTGRVVIERSPEFAPGFTDGVHWRQPVRIRYTTEG